MAVLPTPSVFCPESDPIDTLLLLFTPIPALIPIDVLLSPTTFCPEPDPNATLLVPIIF